MPRHYVRKTQRAGYSKEDLKLAVENVKNNNMTIKQASTTYNVPASTISDRVKGKTGNKSSSLGRGTDIPIEDERRLVEGLKTMEKWGFGLSRVEVLDTVFNYVTSNNIKTRFKDNYPGEDWFLGFKQRHNLSIKKPQKVESSRKKSIDPFIIYPFFNKLEEVVNAMDLGDKPHRIWNLDETSFCTDPYKTKVVGLKGTLATRQISGSGKENISVCFACNAAGGKAPPLIIFKGQNMWRQWVANKDLLYPGTSFAATSNGWMESGTFLEYFKKTFLPATEGQRPALLIYDGHSSHLSLDLVECAIENEIVILLLPAHSSHALQPLDVSTFASLKTKWDEKLVAWQRKNLGERLSKHDFSIKVGAVWKEMQPQILINGFRKCGIFPLNKTCVPDSAFDPVSLKRWKDQFEESSSEVTVTHDRVITKDAATSTSDSLPAPRSFEEILLDQVKRACPSTNKPPRKKLCPGGEVITTDEFITKLKEANTKNGPSTSGATRRLKLKKKQAKQDLGGIDALLQDDIAEIEDLEDDHVSNEMNKTSTLSVSVGDFIMANFKGGNRNARNFRYVCIVQDVKTDELAVMGMRSIDHSKTIFKTVESDVSVIDTKSILKILPPPKMVLLGERVTYKFDEEVDCFEL